MKMNLYMSAIESSLTRHQRAHSEDEPIHVSFIKQPDKTSACHSEDEPIYVSYIRQPDTTSACAQ